MVSELPLTNALRNSQVKRNLWRKVSLQLGEKTNEIATKSKGQLKSHKLRREVVIGQLVKLERQTEKVKA